AVGSARDWTRSRVPDFRPRLHSNGPSCATSYPERSLIQEFIAKREQPVPGVTPKWVCFVRERGLIQRIKTILVLGLRPSRGLGSRETAVDPCKGITGAPPRPIHFGDDLQSLTVRPVWSHNAIYASMDLDFGYC